jgi:hypothetical protein
MDLTIANGGEFERVRVRPRGGFVVGVDPGQSQDPTALCVVEWQTHGGDEWRAMPGNGRAILYQQKRESFAVRHLERLPLDMSYVDVARYVRQLLQRSPLDQDCVDLLVDNTGIGRAVCDIMERERLPIVRITITAGNEVTSAGNTWHVPKIALVSALDGRLNCGELRIAEQLSESPALREELKEFRRNVSDSGRSVYGARSGKHDDLVLACAMCVWWVGRPQKGEYSCSYVLGHY